jgi:hypothetical protein
MGIDYRSVISMADKQVTNHMLPANTSVVTNEKAYIVHNRISILADITDKAGIATLMSLWEMYREGLWIYFIPEKADPSEYRFYDYVQDQFKSCLSKGYQADMERIIRRVFQPCHSRVILGSDGERITPHLLAATLGITALRQISQKLSYAKEDHEVDEVIKAASEGRSIEDIELIVAAQASTNDRIILPTYEIKLNQDGTWKVEINQLSEDQLQIFRQLIGMYADERLA